ncbi:sporulation protein YqfC [Haloimpatiens sp. FM7330]|uniref:sporulation protein YqfC n=1 Tax=Haloimpatiens sp. FM7330 TaxID=3298610 RepID=UPI00363ABA25
MEDKFYRTKQVIADKLELPRDIILDLPKIIITGDNEITIENHKGIVLFEEKIIKINSTIGVISVIGNKFEILFIGGSTITLSGKFKSIVYDGHE